MATLHLKHVNGVSLFHIKLVCVLAAGFGLGLLVSLLTISTGSVCEASDAESQSWCGIERLIMEGN